MSERGIPVDPTRLPPGQKVRVEIEGTVVQASPTSSAAALQLADGSIWGPIMPKSAKFFVVDGDALLAEYVASIPEGTPTLRESWAARYGTAMHEAAEEEPDRG